jgi:hypothetical protein
MTERSSKERDIASEYREAARKEQIVIRPTPAQERALRVGGGSVPDRGYPKMEGGTPVLKDQK